MRVAIVTESFLPQVNGVTNSVLRVLEFLAQEGHQALVIAPESVGGPSEYAGHRVKRVPALPLQSLLPIGLPVAVPTRKLEYLIDGFAPDLLHLASPFALGAYSSRIARRLSIPTLSVYQTDLAGFAKHYGFTAAHNTLRKIVGKIHTNTSRTLAPSTAACADLRECGVENVHLWRRGVNTELFHPSKRSAQLRHSWQADAPAEKMIVGYVGRLANEKRVHDLAIIDRDPRFQLVIVGDGPAREKLQSELKDAFFTGFLGGEELAAAYASFDLFIHPGPNETFCQAVQEALSSGTPCIVPLTGGPADLVSHESTGYVIDTKNSALLLATVEGFHRRSDKEAMREMARYSVEERTWRRINNQLLAHYESVISANQAKRSHETNAPAA